MDTSTSFGLLLTVAACLCYHKTGQPWVKGLAPLIIAFVSIILTGVFGGLLVLWGGIDYIKVAIMVGLISGFIDLALKVVLSVLILTKIIQICRG